ncbi:TetR/AcrR family transcriptional regulator [Streptomyces physcomitrii]|uniref:TetR/AcrR family transcriptional regulator n=1 Tax=Streptomyces physcomitrii TaxID=2724184 RepID=A0ABX1H2F1_9ACTN|nr:TetR/AcrR family transcriptional regulator [Streptomyces physcomitrii]NKI41206.1 TetR/AcrR family transcriptional regulator [Streptomyces physcomitrii]
MPGELPADVHDTTTSPVPTGPAVERGPRERILDATTALLAEGGREAVSTRAVGAAAGVQAPTIYRLFGDKQGLFDAVAAEGFRAYLDSKTAREPLTDPVDDLRAGWDLHIGFGLANPALYQLMCEPRPGAVPPAAAAGADILAAHIRRIAEAGRLRIGEERATHLVQAAGTGAALTLIAMPEERRDLDLSLDAREAVIAAITTEAPVLADPGPVGAAVALRAALPGATALTDLERALLREWLDRIAGTAEPR